MCENTRKKFKEKQKIVIKNDVQNMQDVLVEKTSF